MRPTPDGKLTHTYEARLVWTGNLGAGTAAYAGYDRSFTIRVEGKPELAGSANAAFRGDPARHDPEDLFLSAIASCHMLAYLALCARRGIEVVAYEDQATGVLITERDRGGRFVEVALAPVVTIARAEDEETARELHETAHERCFIANSCSVPIRCRPTVRMAVDAVDGRGAGHFAPPAASPCAQGARVPSSRSRTIESAVVTP